MKKLLGIVVLGLLLTGNSFAGCKKDIKFNWSKAPKGSGAGEVFFNFKNNGREHIRITLIYVKDADGDEIIEFKPKSDFGSKGIFVDPRNEYRISRTDWNAYKYGKTAGWKCSYQKPYEKSIGDKTDNALGVVSDFFSDLFSSDKDD